MRRAFTLIELLVVISIIALLIAILLPVLGRAKWQVILTQCATNQQQWGVAYASYASDNKGKFPSYYIGAGHNPQEISPDHYDVMREDYGMEFETFFCPEHPDQYNTEAWMTQSSDPNRYWIGYFVMIPRPRQGSQALVPFPNQDADGKEISLGPSSVEDVHLAENATMTDSLMVFPRGGTWAPEWGDGHDFSGDPESINVLFGDGHVQTKRDNDWEFRYTSLNADIWY